MTLSLADLGSGGGLGRATVFQVKRFSIMDVPMRLVAQHGIENGQHSANRPWPARRYYETNPSHPGGWRRVDASGQGGLVVGARLGYWALNGVAG